MKPHCGVCGAPHDTVCEAEDCGRTYHGACDPDNHADHPYYLTSM